MHPIHLVIAGKWLKNSRQETKEAYPDYSSDQVKMEKENQSDLVVAMVRQIIVDEPRLMQLIERFGNKNKAGKQKDAPGEIIRRLRIQNKKLQAHGTLLKEQLKKNNTERDHIMTRVDQLEKLNQRLAEALGACAYCWGEDSSCDQCGGDGGPGWTTINMQKFILYVLPGLGKIIPLK
jgi:hypothetical protein